MITPLDVQKQQFKKSLTGYNRDEVDDYMLMVADALEKHINENIRLKEKLDRKDEEIKHYKNIERTMSDTLVVAKQTAEELTTSAKQTSQNIIKQAEIDAKKLINKADATVAKTMQQQQKMEKDLAAFRARLEAMLRAQLDIVANYSNDLK